MTKKLYGSGHVKHLPFFSLPPKIASVAKDDLIHSDTFPSDVYTEENISTLKVSNLPTESSAPSQSTLLLPFPYASLVAMQLLRLRLPALPPLNLPLWRLCSF